MRVLVTGSRDYSDRDFIRGTLNSLARYAEMSRREELELIVGDCETGADAHARDWADDYGYEKRVFEADWATHNRAAGPRRNVRMVDEGRPDIGLAFFEPGARNRGTKHCADYAESKGVRVYRFAE
ncbi:SLOG family protein [Dactylosporangium sp. CA-139066]|uniref:SLOG family protein n=1 Tax=Dactylosporangium sp. CA-139066 TaxID=3239930 RepID=UPI003D8E4ABD